MASVMTPEIYKYAMESYRAAVRDGRNDGQPPPPAVGAGLSAKEIAEQDLPYSWVDPREAANYGRAETDRERYERIGRAGSMHADARERIPPMDATTLKYARESHRMAVVSGRLTSEQAGPIPGTRDRYLHDVDVGTTRDRYARDTPAPSTRRTYNRDDRERRAAAVREFAGPTQPCGYCCGSCLCH